MCIFANSETMRTSRGSQHPGSIAAVAAVTVLVAVAGCGAALTKTQTAAIQDFAQANDMFVKFPAAVLRTYEEVHLETRTFDATSVGARDASRAVTQLVRAVEFDAVTEVLCQYAALLRRLSSDMSGGVDEAAADLGSALDTSIGGYNRVSGGAPLSLVGAGAASAARAAGGLYIKHRQLVYLREFVGRADPLVTRLAGDVGVLVGSFIGADGYLGADTTSIQRTLAVYASAHGTALTVSDVHLFGEALRKEALAATLAEDVQHMSTELAKTHSALKGVLDPRTSSVNAKAELQVLIAELQAAARVKAKLDGTNKQAKE